jgi:hypothetical protein
MRGEEGRGGEIQDEGEESKRKRRMRGTHTLRYERAKRGEER